MLEDKVSKKRSKFVFLLASESSRSSLQQGVDVDMPQSEAFSSHGSRTMGSKQNPKITMIYQQPLPMPWQPIITTKLWSLINSYY